MAAHYPDFALFVLLSFGFLYVIQYKHLPSLVDGLFTTLQGRDFCLCNKDRINTMILRGSRDCSLGLYGCEQRKRPTIPRFGASRKASLNDIGGALHFTPYPSSTSGLEPSCNNSIRTIAKTINVHSHVSIHMGPRVTCTYTYNSNRSMCLLTQRRRWEVSSAGIRRGCLYGGNMVRRKAFGPVHEERLKRDVRERSSSQDDTGENNSSPADATTSQSMPSNEGLVLFGLDESPRLQGQRHAQGGYPSHVCVAFTACSSACYAQHPLYEAPDNLLLLVLFFHDPRTII